MARRITGTTNLCQFRRRLCGIYRWRHEGHARLLLYRQGMREIKRLVHPNAEIPVKLGSQIVPPRVIDSVWGSFAVYVVVFAVMMVVLLIDGVDQVTAFSAIAASLNNLGPGLGDVATGFGSLSDLSK